LDFYPSNVTMMHGPININSHLNSRRGKYGNQPVKQNNRLHEIITTSHIN